MFCSILIFHVCDMLSSCLVLDGFRLFASRPRYKYRKKCSKFLSRNSHKIPKFLLNLV